MTGRWDAATAARTAEYAAQGGSMTTATRPAPVLTEAQYTELWTMFCQYGRLREYQGESFGTHHPDHPDRRAEADAAQMRFGAVLASLTVLGAVSGE